MSTTPTAERPGNFRWVLSTLLFVSTSLYYYDRQIPAIAINLPEYARHIGFLKADGTVDKVLFGYIDSAHKVCYAIGFLLMGRFIDWIGLKRGFALGVGLWSLAAISFVFLHNFWALIFGMACLGFFQASNHPACVKTVAGWFPTAERADAVAFYNSGTNFGAMIVSKLVPFVCLALSWQYTYILPGLVGLLWVVAWYMFYDTPEHSRFVGPAERAHITRGLVPVPQRTLGWLHLFTLRSAWGFAIAKLMIDPVWFLYLTWLPIFLNEKLHINIKALFIPIMAIYLLSLVGNFVGGRLSGYFLARGWTVNRSRKLSLLVFALMAVPSFAAAYVSNLWIIVGVLGWATFAHQAFSTLLYTTVTDVFPKEVVGSVTGFGSMFGAVGAAVITVSVGYIINAFGYTPLFFLGPVAYLIALGILHACNPQLAPETV